MVNLVTEFIEMFALAFVACRVAMFAGGGIGFAGIFIAFGLILVGLFYGLEQISKCLVRPGGFLAGRMSLPKVGGYVLAQLAGIILATNAVFLVANGSAPLNSGGFAANALQNWASVHAGVAIAIFLFLRPVQSDAPSGFAGIGIGFMRTQLGGNPIANTSFNFACSTGAVLFEQKKGAAPAWVFNIGPVVGAAQAGLLLKFRWLARQ